MLSRRRATAGNGPITANLAVVTVFALIVTALLTNVWVDSRGVSSDLRGTISPRLSVAQTQKDTNALLDATGEASERFAVALLPIAASLGRAADSTGTAVVEATAVRAHTRATAEALASLDSSVAAIKALSDELAPLVASALASTGDINDHLTAARREAAVTARLIEKVRGHISEFVGDARTLRSRTRAISAALERIERHSRQIAAADALQCPENARACPP